MELNKIYQGHCLEVLKTLPSKTINTVVTSPPYWGLRDYGVEGQIGLENSVEEYVSALVDVFREIKRILKDDGTVWVNLGDAYAGSGKGAWAEKDKQKHVYVPDTKSHLTNINNVPTGLKPKDLIGLPWRVAFALQADGWYLRQDIIWDKPNCMPESVKDRPTRCHEYVFLLAKNKDYYYDYKSILEPIAISTSNDKRTLESRFTNKRPERNFPGQSSKGGGMLEPLEIGKRNKRSVWSVTTKPFKEAHFATFPEDLIEPCILAGCPLNGVVMDPFFGSGTTGLVALKHGRNFIGIELNKEYIKIAEKRLSKVQLELIHELGC
ncbi:site-specific DNA-methyltransferase [Lysinibacillus sp. 1 U-2021]|uniref:DNA-methyltransferase n=1 Tax=Lysinibacillus sp. 1 U-2021 TaxID=3039426 RepID=UPI0024815D76|nr:site-specific DNA-methyltransferase [Lysinibacillus sp. 1 U-2021]WGT40111.1 site-specific DNA-methyltransferase [Lysinibacillus sp. 1 U-2021]